MKLFCASELGRAQPPSAPEVSTALWTVMDEVTIILTILHRRANTRWVFCLVFFYSKVVNVYIKGTFWGFYVLNNKESFDQCLSVSLQRAENVVVWLSGTLTLLPPFKIKSFQAFLLLGNISLLVLLF